MCIRRIIQLKIINKIINKRSLTKDTIEDNTTILSNKTENINIGGKHYHQQIKPGALWSMQRESEATPLIECLIMYTPQPNTLYRDKKRGEDKEKNPFCKLE